MCYTETCRSSSSVLTLNLSWGKQREAVCCEWGGNEATFQQTPASGIISIVVQNNSFLSIKTGLQLAKILLRPKAFKMSSRDLLSSFHCREVSLAKFH